MELFWLILAALFGSILAKPLEGRWIFPDEFDALTKGSNRFDFFQPKNVPTEKPDRGPNGRKIIETTPLPDVMFRIPNCKCKFPHQYNPVCGSDGLSYANAQMLKCVRRCGNNVVVVRMGTCRGRFSVDK